MERMKELVKILNEASLAYYSTDKEIMPNAEYDSLYDELVKLEEESGIVLSNSPTHKVGYSVVSELEKSKHEKPALSLDKTKQVDQLKDFLDNKEGIISWKLDGLTVVLTYDDGSLSKAVTRGNGYEGEIITNNALTFKNLPKTIPFKGHLVLRGEAVIKYSDFEQFKGEYKNPRNLCSGSIRQLDSSITADRHVNFVAFSLVSGFDCNTIEESFDFLINNGFEVVDHYQVTKDNIDSVVESFKQKVDSYDIPSDGLVLIYNDIKYGESLGSTAHSPRNSIAFKWQDETEETTLRYIEWNASRTGLINPIAVFDPVEIEGTIVQRASVHNLSIIKSLKLGIGDKIKVYKANMIIPQILEDIEKSDNADYPCICPVCGSKTTICNSNGIQTLWCLEESCPAKQIKSLVQFCSRNAMNIDGISEATIEKFVDEGFISNYNDFYSLYKYKNDICNLEGFGEKSYNNLIESIDKSRKVKLFNFIYALCIPNVGLQTAKLICKYFNNDLDKLRKATRDQLLSINGIGEQIADSIFYYFQDENIIDDLLNNIHFEEEEMNNNKLNGSIFVITGSVNHFSNREELKAFIEKNGGVVAGSVSAKTNYLINNDILSNSSKNKKAKELGISIITEEEFLNMIGE